MATGGRAELMLKAFLNSGGAREEVTATKRLLTQYFSSDKASIDRMNGIAVRADRKRLSELFDSPFSRFLVSVFGFKMVLFSNVNRNAAEANIGSNNDGEKDKGYRKLRILKRDELLQLGFTNPFSEATRPGAGKEDSASEAERYYWSIDFGDIKEGEKQNEDKEEDWDKVEIKENDANEKEKEAGKEKEKETGKEKQALTKQQIERLVGECTFKPLRPAALELSYEESHILAFGKALVDWNYRNQYCPGCGYETWSGEGGCKRYCMRGRIVDPTTTNESKAITTPKCGGVVVNDSAQTAQELVTCTAQKQLNNFYFPRTDPVVIVGILSPKMDKILLARKKGFPSQVFSCIAGFVDAGETINDAVRREVMEEVGINISEIEYFDSQTWPFPNSLMIGCFARASPALIPADSTFAKTTGSNSQSIDQDDVPIVVDHEELEEARWFTFNEIYPAVVRSHDVASILSHKKSELQYGIPPYYAIGSHLVRYWCECVSTNGKL
ncbi:Peroxisomal NADH pyrophosphatase NUDT12 [Zancudomyces culisetae]|uniref:NAD(+) diphosphatase n=1 Tax=Zancudomyces culisetae TaxID=1213189 RepID=A0A1R1PX43_ZANCU|nr:Peroxisomal NADH pyrophosphatase NUDT12 [Zancudomyces culisetae]|eukprot:OMH85508.1 Peroxisomal NADH pyrophosphatase NUDT12 [Zancudomyces culisetae]